MPDFTKGHWSVENGVDIISDMYNFVRCVYEMSKTLDEEDDDYFIHEAAKKILDRIHGSEDHAHDEHA